MASDTVFGKPTIPVLIEVAGSSEVIQTYVALASQCKTTFISSNLISRLKLENLETKNVLISTLFGKDKCTAKVVRNIKLSNLSGTKSASIDIAFSLNSWPFDKSNVPTYKQIENIPHLNKLPLEFIDEEIGFIVGPRHAGLIAPREIENGPNAGDPYAVKYSLGWSVEGPLKATQGAIAGKTMSLYADLEVLEDEKEISLENVEEKYYNNLTDRRLNN